LCLDFEWSKLRPLYIYILWKRSSLAIRNPEKNHPRTDRSNLGRSGFRMYTVFKIRTDLSGFWMARISNDILKYPDTHKWGHQYSAAKMIWYKKCLVAPLGTEIYFVVQGDRKTTNRLCKKYTYVYLAKC
jgi:hypothetical protein